MSWMHGQVNIFCTLQPQVSELRSKLNKEAGSRWPRGIFLPHAAGTDQGVINMIPHDKLHAHAAESECMAKLHTFSRPASAIFQARTVFVTEVAFLTWLFAR